MPNWKKVVTSGSSPEFNNVTLDGTLNIPGFSNVSSSLASLETSDGTKVTRADLAFTSSNSVTGPQQYSYQVSTDPNLNYWLVTGSRAVILNTARNYPNIISGSGGNSVEVIVNGLSNCINQQGALNFQGTPYSSVVIVNGDNNTISGSGCSTIVGGHNNKLTHTRTSTIGGGNSNCIEGTFSANVVHMVSNSIVGGQHNRISGSSGPFNPNWFNIIGGGEHNRLYQTGCSIIGAGHCNRVLGNNADFTNGNRQYHENSIVGGRCNDIIDEKNSHIVGGACNKICGDSTQNTVVQGSGNIIGAGHCNVITGSYCSAILGGKNNCLKHDNSFIIGSCITSNAACTTFVNNLCISGSLNGSTITGVTASFGEYIGIPSSDPFPYTASSGPAIISQSFTAGNVDSTALRLLGSGSVSQSGIFEVEGSAGPLFSVQDGLDGVLMEVNNISGLPLFQVSSSNEVFINRGNLTSGVTTATASFAHFTGSFQGDGSQLTNLNTTTPTLQQVTDQGATTTNDITITGSLTISGSFHSFTLDSDNIVLGSGAGTSMQAGADNNVILGTNAGTSLTTGDKNVIIGNAAGAAVATSSEVVYIGNLAGGSRTGAGNIAIGNYAAQSSAASTDIIAIGRTAARYTTGGGSIAIGRDALKDGNTDVYNIAIGYDAAEGSTLGPNISIGACVLKTNGAGRHNTIIGHNAGEDIQGGCGNTMLGHHAGKDLQSGTGNIIIGSGSLGTDSPSNQLRIGNGNSIVTISGSLETGDVIFYNTASAPNFSGSFQGDGSQLTNLPAATAGSTAGRVVFTTTSGELTTESGFEYDTSTNQLSVDSLNVIHLTSSFITSSRIHTSGSNIFGDDTTDTQTLIGTVKITGSAQITGSLTGTPGTTNNLTASYAITASHALSGGDDAFPFIGDAQITGSLTISGSGGLSVESSGSTVFEVIGSEGTLFSIDDDLDGTIFTANDRSGFPVLEASASGEVYIGKAPQSLYTTAVISSTTAATTQSIFGLSTSSYGGAFFDYTVQSGSDARAGSIMSVWNGSNISFTETTTTDIGDTTDFNVIVHISQSQAQIASHASRAGYNIKTIIRSI